MILIFILGKQIYIQSFLVRLVDIKQTNKQKIVLEAALHCVLPRTMRRQG